MLPRSITAELRSRLAQVPAVALLGPRQVGKTTLAQQLAAERPTSVYLDLESPADRARLTDADAYLETVSDRLVVLDEIQRVPDLFPTLRGLIDRGRRRGQRAGRFLLLGSASMDLMRQSGESLAGRITYLELGPLNVLECGRGQQDALWLRGGFPESFLAVDDAASIRWRRDFIRTYLERDIPSLGPRVPAETFRRFWTMLAHQQGAISNAASLARSLGLDGKTIASYLDLLVDLLLVRRLAPWHRNVGKRLVKTPKIYVRDSGLVHALLGLTTLHDLLGHPVVGGSWEGHAIESLAAAAPEGAELNFYRTHGGAEIDLVVTLTGKQRRPWAIEVKRSTAPTLDRGFHEACEDLEPSRKFVVYPGVDRYPLSRETEAISVAGLCELLRDAS